MNSLNVGLVMNFFIMHLNVIKERKKYKGKFNSRRDRDRNYLYANEDEESNEKGHSESDDELGFGDIKEDELDREIREERALVSQVENKSDWIVDNGCSHHMTGDMNKFVKFKIMMEVLLDLATMQPII